MSLERNNLPAPTPREREVLECMAQGLVAKEIAVRLGMCERTVVNHKADLMHKWNAKNSNELVQIYLSNFLNK